LSPTLPADNPACWRFILAATGGVHVDERRIAHELDPLHLPAIPLSVIETSADEFPGLLLACPASEHFGGKVAAHRSIQFEAHGTKLQLCLHRFTCFTAD
jgi:hypothetical protein